MIPANDISGRRNEIKDFLAAADLDNAVKRLIDFLRDFLPELENDALLLSRKYSDIERNERLGLLDYQAIEIAKNQVGNGMLKTLDLAYLALDGSQYGGATDQGSDYYRARKRISPSGLPANAPQ